MTARLGGSCLFLRWHSLAIAQSGKQLIRYKRWTVSYRAMMCVVQCVSIVSRSRESPGG